MSTQLDKLLTMPIRGTHYHDSALFALAHEILMGDYPLDEKKAALKRIDEAMGCTRPIDDAAVQEYVDFVNKEGGDESRH
jgi:hypothetical protein